MEDVPAAVRSLITAAVADELATTYDDQVVFPRHVVIDLHEDPDRRFPEWPTPVLVIAVENQGVCSWGVPLDDPALPVVVGDSGGTIVYTPDVASYLAARRWDRRCVHRGPLLQAQAAELDDDSLARLRADFDEQPATHGWPGHTQFRFERDGVMILLWSDAGQCDWWLSGPADALSVAVGRLLSLSDLSTSLWSNDAAGEALLVGLRKSLEDPANQGDQP
ncbi:hypothetical protein Ais01nite_16530 [Asanoa ishikariensis]|uniref:Uncharacterized protein n=1 Tax=Asanoa ishikariensis TaxID=137265 RepID=A0A1H3UG74_9ACTN|nr:hypothetical protein [Asanoa ishikariensis]GIF63618.1 hypothetical protein Ais01nite_16530 [Asanoa ishikariensis]SDZ61296.1 hypothetical protein SAMN05421684_7220 [Asanoa ishikariensis]